MKRFRGPSPDEKQARFSISLAVGLKNRVAALAQNERRSLAVMCAILIEEALAQREAQDAPKVEEGGTRSGGAKPAKLFRSRLGEQEPLP